MPTHTPQEWSHGTSKLDQYYNVEMCAQRNGVAKFLLIEVVGATIYILNKVQNSFGEDGVVVTLFKEETFLE